MLVYVCLFTYVSLVYVSLSILGYVCWFGACLCMCVSLMYVGLAYGRLCMLGYVSLCMFLYAC